MSSLSRFFLRSLSTLSSSSAQSKSVYVGHRATELYGERDFLKLVQKFMKSSENDRFRTRIGVYDDTVRRLAGAKQFTWIEEILEDQKKYKDISKEGFTVRLISLYGKSGMFDHAQKLFDEMPNLKCDRSVLSFNGLLGACVNSKKFDKVNELFNQLPAKLSITPDVVSYNVVIKALCEMGSFDAAVKMLDEMEKKGFEPDLITFNTFFRMLYTSGRYLDGEKMWALMEKKNVVPDIKSYNSKFIGMASEKKTSEAVQLVKEMQAKGINPDISTINALINGFCDEDNIKEAKKWYREIRIRECAPNKDTFPKLVPVVCVQGHTKTAYVLFKDIFKHKSIVEEALLQLVVDCLVKESKIHQAKELVELAKSNKYCTYDLKLPAEK